MTPAKIKHLSITEVAKKLGRSRSSVVWLVKKGYLKTEIIGGLALISSDQLIGIKERLPKHGQRKPAVDAPYKAVLLAENRVILEELGEFPQFTKAQQAARGKEREGNQRVAVLDKRNREVWSAGTVGKRAKKKK